MTANLTGTPDIQERFFDWIWDRAEDIDAESHVFKTTGLLYENIMSTTFRRFIATSQTRAARCFSPWPITSKNILKTKTIIWI